MPRRRRRRHRRAPNPLPARIVRAARGQGGAIATRQLTAAGVDKDRIARLLRSGWLVREHQRAYRITGHPASSRTRLYLAQFAYGDDAALTGRAAAVARRLISDPGSTVHVLLPSARRARRGIRPHRGRLRPEQIVLLDGLRVVCVARMLLDVAAQESPSVLRLVVRKAAEQGLLTTAVLEELRVWTPRHVGSRPLADALAARDPNRGETRSSLERRLSAFLVEYGFPPAERNVKLHLDDGEVLTLADFVWWWACCSLEADHRSTHSSGERFDEDRRISRKLQAAGWSAPRATGADLDTRARRDALALELWAIFDAAIARWWAP